MSSALLWMGGYALACLGIGLWTAFRMRGADDFFIAGRSLGAILLGVSAFASTVTGFAFIGGPALIYSSGGTGLWILLTGPLGAALVWWLLARPLYRLSARQGLCSLPGVIAHHYGSRTAGLLGAAVLVAGVIAYLGVQLIALTTVVTGLDSSVDATTAMVVSAIVLTGYATLGGTLASVWTDALQGLLMAVAAIGVLFVVAGAFPAGEGSISAIFAEHDPQGITPFGSLGAALALGWFLLFTLGNAGQPHVMRKLMMARSESALRWSLPMVVMGGSLAALLWLLVGLAVRAAVLNGDMDADVWGHGATMAFLHQMAPPWVLGLVVAGLLGAIMSSADAFLNQGAIALTRDLRELTGRRAAKNPLREARIATLLLGLGALALAIDWSGLLVMLGIMGWGLWAAAFVPVLAIGLNWPLAHRHGAVASLALSLGGTLALRTGMIAPPAGLGGGEILFCLSLVVFVAVSLVARTRESRFTPPE